MAPLRNQADGPREPQVTANAPGGGTRKARTPHCPVLWTGRPGYPRAGLPLYPPVISRTWSKNARFRPGLMPHFTGGDWYPLV